MSKALDEVRAEESRRMRSEGRAPVLKKSRWLLLKRKENLAEEKRFRLRDLLRSNLKTVRAYLLKEVFQQLWDYNSPAWAGKFFDEWCHQTMRSRIEPMKKIARSLRQHRELILKYFRAQKLISSGVVEGLDNVRIRRSQLSFETRSSTPTQAVRARRARCAGPRRVSTTQGCKALRDRLVRQWVGIPRPRDPALLMPGPA